jgi:predicted MFS family arabinose efflux permease
VAPTLGVSMSVAAYNLGTAVGSWIAGLTLGSALGATGPAVAGTLIASLTLVPAVAIAIAQRRRATRATAGHRPCIDP